MALPLRTPPVILRLVSARDTPAPMKPSPRPPARLPRVRIVVVDTCPARVEYRVF